MRSLRSNIFPVSLPWPRPGKPLMDGERKRGRRRMAIAMAAFASIFCIIGARLVLYGGWADGSAIGDEDSRRHVLGLLATHWGFGSDVLAELFAPDADAGTRTAFARYQRAQARNPSGPRERKLHELDRRALETLGFAGHVESVEIKKAYKALVKIHHPDANGGDKSSEDRLRAIIAAYTHLKTKGFV